MSGDRSDGDDPGRSREDGGRSDGRRPTPPAHEADEPTFAAPWQARAFALVVALTDEDDDDHAWAAFQRELVAELPDAGEDAVPAGDAAAGGDDVDAAGLDGSDEAYYRGWLRALERFLADRGAVDPGALVDRAAAFAAGERDAHEFVDGDPRAHADRLPEGHADGGHGHDHDHD